MLNLRATVVVFALLTAITGLAYPLTVTLAGRLLFPRQVSGSLIEERGRAIGSELIAQSFQDARYFWGRPSATMPMPNDGLASGGSNLGPSNPSLLDAVSSRIMALKAADPANDALVPVDLVTASGSGLDPHISPAAALFQVARVAAARGMSNDAVRSQVLAAIEPPQWGLFGEPRINVLRLNLVLDGTR